MIKFYILKSLFCLKIFFTNIQRIPCSSSNWIVIKVFLNKKIWVIFFITRICIYLDKWYFVCEIQKKWLKCKRLRNVNSKMKIISKSNGYKRPDKKIHINNDVPISVVTETFFVWFLYMMKYIWIFVFASYLCFLIFLI